MKKFLRVIGLAYVALALGTMPVLAQVAISGLPAATTPTSTGDVAPIVQGGVTKKVGLGSILPNTAVTPGTYGDATHCSNFTVQADGRLTAAAQSTSCPGSGGGGSGNFTLSPATGNTVGDCLQMSNTTTTGTDSGLPCAAPATQLAHSTSFTITANQFNNQDPVLATGTLTETFPATSGLSANGFQFLQNSGTNTLTIQPNAVDQVCVSGSTCGSSGAAFALAANFGAIIQSDAAGHLYVTPITPSGGGGSGTVTSVATGAGLTGGTITGSGTIATTYVIRAVTGTSDTILSSDAAKLVTYNNASSVAVTLPQATGSFAAGFAVDVQNKGAGTVTVTPTTSTVNGSSTLTIAQNRGCTFVSDGTNYQVSACNALGP